MAPRRQSQSGNNGQGGRRGSSAGNSKCVFCDKAFSHNGHLWQHILVHIKEKPFACRYKECHKAFNCKASLRIHSRVHSGERPYSCDFCDRSFTQWSSRYRHQRVHTGERPFSCDSCDKAFSQECNLREHQRLHTGKRSYSCVFCSKAFTRSSHLTSHVKIHTKERHYMCSECDLEFPYSKCLKCHQRFNHNGNSVDLDATQVVNSDEEETVAETELFHCRFCSMIHSKERPYTCQICGERFVTNKQRMTHKRALHAGVRVPRRRHHLQSMSLLQLL